MPTTNINGFTMYYEQDGDGTPLVYVHGGNTCLLHALLYGRRPFHWGWRQDFAEHFRFIWYERRGCYRSSTPDDDYSLEIQASDLGVLLDHLNVACAHVVGMSAGGPIAVIFAATKPDRVRSLTLISTGLDLWSDDPKMAIVRGQLAILQREGAEAAFDQRPAEAEISLDPLWEREEMTLLGKLDAWQEQQRTLAQDAADVPRVERIRRYAAELKDMTAGMNCDLPSYAARVTARTLVIHGSADPIVPVAQGQALAEILPHAEWRIVEGEGHRMIFTNAAVRQAVIAFAEQVGLPTKIGG